MQTHKTVLITGASQGIGRACAMMAAEKGYRVVV
ncbi:MAG: SDR family NAD(P)-dependent oxidoreductase, partial [Saprospiraceae bacterium]|nr:SDR family NAD(P)-dependent oxidoreductase [Saprospiraceae bacterium]